MPKRTINHRSWRLKRLNEPAVARNYLNAAISDSPDMFLKALRNVAEAHKMAKVANEAGMAREALYKTLSEEGNPRLDTLGAVLKAVGLRIAVEATGSSFPLRGISQERTGSNQAGVITKSRRSRKHSKTALPQFEDLAFFSAALPQMPDSFQGQQVDKHDFEKLFRSKLNEPNFGQLLRDANP